ncbi:hypothetical protein BE20_14080 [Sorangium cellulosum]|uniref:Uncharacterized protein n=1 Tax=Sorangium cellulosum TaxID=56 RepID=A0A150RTV2_SORCE|nr:hypothetical protein BE18_43150 [Sorangium cellulosum]KYF91669.1 hypothetical protein BE20_14080 [Sorangium cellulosum]
MLERLRLTRGEPEAPPAFAMLVRGIALAPGARAEGGCLDVDQQLEGALEQILLRGSEDERRRRILG